MKKKIRKICLVATVFALGLIYVNSYNEEKGVKIEEYNNFYNGESIHMYYENMKNTPKVNKKITELDKTYSVREHCRKEEKEIEKVLKTCSILKAVGQSDDIEETKYLNGYDILINRKEDTKKLSDRDMALIERDLILTLGYESRIGVFRKKNPQFEKNAEYYVVEYWSPKLNKWVLVDFKREGYIKKDGEVLSALEVLESDINEIQFNGEYSSKDYKKEIKSFLDSYSIPIDNTVERKNSNSFITYLKKNGKVDILSEEKYLPPTVFTNNKILFEKTPWSGRKKEDDKTYIVLMKKSLDEEDKALKGEELDKEKNKIILGAFKNGAIQKEYSYKINDGEVRKVKDLYEEIYLPIGKTKISLLNKEGKEESSILLNREK